MFMMLWFFFSIRYDRVHPLESGYFRLKFRRERRPTLPRESMLVFYPRFAWDTVRSHFWMGYWILRMNSVRRRIHADVGVATTPILRSRRRQASRHSTRSRCSLRRAGSRRCRQGPARERCTGRASHRSRYGSLMPGDQPRGDHVNLSSHRDRWGPRADLFPAQSL